MMVFLISNIELLMVSGKGLKNIIPKIILNTFPLYLEDVPLIII